MGLLKGIRKYKVRGLMGLGSLGLAHRDISSWGWVTCPACASPRGELREIGPHMPGKIPRDGLGAVLGTSSHGPCRSPRPRCPSEEGPRAHPENT